MDLSDLEIDNDTSSDEEEDDSPSADTEGASGESEKSGKVDMMREQKRLREQQQIAYQTGNVEEAQRIAQLLMPQGDKDVEWDQKAGKFRKAGARA